ncbi:MAG: DMT family transporter [Ignavibacteria bacterium]|nr:DMT family transporter [Ignavibacteria bacterium]
MLKNNKLTAWILIIILSLIWGTSYILIKKGLDGFSAIQVGCGRIFFAFLVVAPLAIRTFSQIPLKRKPLVFFLGLTGNFIPAFLFSLAETQLESSITGIINSITPVFTLIVGILFFKSKFKIIQILGVLLGLIGTLGIILVGNTGELGSFNFFAVYVIIATILYAFNANMIKHYFQNTGAIALTTQALFFVGPIAIIFLLTTDFINRISDIQNYIYPLLSIFILGTVGTAFALILYNKLIRITSPVFATMVTYLMPSVAIVWGILDGEVLFPLHYAGFILVLIGVYLTNRG